MEIKFVLLIFGISQIFATDLSKNEYYYPDDDNGTSMVKMLFSKLNTVLLENNNISKTLMEINKRLEDQTKALENMPQLTEDIASIKKSLNESFVAKPLKLHGTWNIIQRRQDGSENFNRNWNQYKTGFGNPNDNEFFIGLEKLHKLTAYETPQELSIVLKDFDDQTRYARYDSFVVGSETEKYALKELGEYSGDAGDSFTSHKGFKFSTKDQDNDLNLINCAEHYKGGWWFHGGCYTCHLNGQYLNGSIESEGGINWYNWRGFQYSLKFVEMKIRDKL